MSLKGQIAMDSSASTAEIRSFVDLVRRRAAEHGERPLFALLDEQGEVTAELSYAALDRRARAIAARLAETTVPGDRALLLYPFGLDFITAFFGALYAGVVAVPAYPLRSNRSSGRLAAIVQDAGPRLALTVASALPSAKRRESFGLDGIAWLATDEVTDETGERWQPPALDSGSLAFLQYTSGSTSLPKGVAVSHGNLLHNQEMIRAGFDQSAASVVVGWLPLYHDMGLIGNVLQPLYAGGRCYLMPPLVFLQDPHRWLRAISRYGGTTSGGPNFAFELCTRAIGDEKRAELDLSSWRVAFSGAEPVRAATLERFAARFAPAGFRRESFYPCYGLAEATLFVSGGAAEAGAVVVPFDAGALERGVARTDEAERAVALVGCGHARLGQSIRVVDPESRRELTDGEVGEIWVGGASVAQGYWGKPEASAETFGAALADGEGPFLRTGDLGFLRGGELFVTGRRKDLIILRGRNLYPHDVEAAAEAASARLRAGCSAAFAVEVAGEERLVLVCEVDRRTSAADLGEVALAVRAALAEEHEVQIHDLVLAPPGTVLKTSSGKVQRYACRASYLGGVLPRVGGDPAPAVPAADALLGRDALLAMGSEQRRHGVLAHLRGQLAALRLPVPAALDPARTLTALGLDSLAAVELKMRLEEGLGVTLPLADLLGEARLGDLAGQVAEALERGPARAAPALAPRRAELPLSQGQRALWFVERLAPEAAAYNLAGAARLLSELDPAALRRALDRLSARHDSLRTTFHDVDGEPFQRVHETLEIPLAAVDASAWDAAALQERLAAAAYRPFDLESGPLLRVALFSGSAAEHTVLLAVHHLISDFWSLAVLVEELGALYGEEAGGPRADLAPPSAPFAGQVQREEERLRGAEGERLWDFWRGRLAGELPVLDLPWDRPRPRVQTYRGAVRHLRAGTGLHDGVRRLAAAGETTPFAVVLAAFQALLYRWTGAGDLLLGTPASGRGSADLRGTVGYFVNPVPLRAAVSPDGPFAALAAEAQRTVAAAVAHQDLPFALLAQRLQPQRDPGRSPLFQVLVSLQRPRPGSGEGLAALALGLDGVRLAAGALTLESLGLRERRVPLDLALNAAEIGGDLCVAAEFNVDLFDAATVERLLGHLRNLLAGAVADPARAVGELDLLSPAERAELLAAGEGPAAALADAGVQSLVALVAAQAERTPEALAVTAGELRWTYRELQARAGALAASLRAMGLPPEARVGVALDRSPDLVATLLGVLAAGAAYVPVDPAYPLERSLAVLEDAGIAALIAHPEPAERFASAVAGLGVPIIVLPAGSAAPDAPLPGGGVRPAAALSPDRLAYVLYTSGSTGRPKGVQVSHGALAAFLLAMRRRPGFTAGDTLLAVTTIAFDIAGLELFLPLVSGGTVAIADRATAADPVLLLAALRAGGATVLQATPATWRMLVEAGWEGEPRITALCGGEALPRDLAAAVAARSAALWNLYGPTETTIWSSVAMVGEGEGEVPLGEAIAGTSLRLVDRAGNMVPLGVAGELLIGGAGVARGYLGRPDLTAERFVPDPFAGRPGARLYRTGDLVRRRPSGALEFLGRLDHQVKIRGHRIEPGEIEAALLRHPGVREAVVAAVAAKGAGGPRLVAYVVPAAERRPGSPELRAWLAGLLPEYMVPGAFVTLESLPRTPNGKVDRRALPVPAFEAAGGGAATGAAGDPVAELLAQIFAQVLDRSAVGSGDDFFELGGHSLLATRVVSRIRSVLGRELPVAELFKHPTPARLSAALAAMASPGLPPLPQVLAGERGAESPLSFPQQRLWFLDRLEPGHPVYNMAHAVRLRGPFAPAALAAALDRMVARHEALRTTFTDRGGRPVQVVAPRLAMTLPCVDLRALPPARREREQARLVREEARRAFDLERGPLLRLLALRAADGEHAVVLVMHHIVGDGWSMGVLLGELEAGYNAAVGGLGAAGAPLPPPLALQYSDFSSWQQRHLPRAEDLDYWRQRLAALPALELPLDRPRPPVETYEGATGLPLRLLAELAAELKALSARQGATLFMTLAGLFTVLLHRVSGQDDFGIGTPVANRFQPELEDLIGFFTNTLVLRADLGGDPDVPALLARTRASALAAYAHQHLPFERLVEEVQPERNLGRNPLFQVFLVMLNTPTPKLELAGLELAPLAVDTRTSKFDLSLFLWEEGDELAGSVEYSTELFDAATVTRLLGHYRTLLAHAAAAPATPIAHLPLLDAMERTQIVEEWNDTGESPLPEGCVQQVVESWAFLDPERIAVTFHGESLTYGELNERANRLAHALRRRGVGPNVAVGICLERSLAMTVAVLAALKAGGACLPLDPSYPAERLAFMLADSGAPVLLSQQGLLGLFPAFGGELLCAEELGELLRREPAENPLLLAGPDDLAYLIYTSGSTGRPKGIGMPQRVLVNLTEWQCRRSSGAPRTLQFSALSFDVSLQEVFATWAVGGVLVLVGEEERRDPVALLEILESERVERIFLPFVALHYLAEAGERLGIAPSCLREVITAGEQLRITEAVAGWFRRLHGCLLDNQYGPSETHIVTGFAMRGNPAWWPALPTIGRPIRNTTAYILDRTFEPVPVGVPAELYIGGIQVARCYLDRPALTAEKFLPDPFGKGPGERLYRTGDLARWMISGDIEFLGRIDHQVKVRGFRIELGEVESVLAQHPGVRAAAVAAPEVAGMKRLVAYVVPAAGSVDADPLPAPTDAELRAFLEERLPSYMVPSHFMQLAALPLTATGKLDRRSLPAPDRRAGQDDEFVPPRTPIEETLALIWSELLGVDRVGMRDNFFDLGGHSLLATRVGARVQEVFGVGVPLRRLFEAPTVESLAAAVDAALFLKLSQLSDEEAEELLGRSMRDAVA